MGEKPRPWLLDRDVTDSGVVMRTLRLLSLASLLLAACTSSSASGDGTGSPASGGPSTDKPAPPRTGPADDPEEVDPAFDPNAPPCTGAPGELYALSARALGATESVPLCRFAGSVLLVVNVASHCGYTPQYAPLQALYDEYKAQKFYVLGFPSNSFNQESADEKEISTFCTNEYKITFPMFAIGNVNPPEEQPVYTWLKSQPGQATDVAWNFEKFLISRKGQVVTRFLTAVEPDSAEMASAIEAELAK